MLQRKAVKQAAKNDAGLVSIEAGIERLPASLFSPSPNMDLNIRNSQQKAELHHFKVMQLSVHEDDRGSKSKLDCRFHFLFDMVRKKPRNYL